jgi:hypothetical protein
MTQLHPWDTRPARAVLLVLAMLTSPALLSACTEDEADGGGCGKICDCVATLGGDEARDGCWDRCPAILESDNAASGCRAELAQHGFDACWQTCPQETMETSAGDASRPMSSGDQAGPGDSSVPADEPDPDPEPDQNEPKPDGGSAESPCVACLRAECYGEFESCAAVPACVSLQDCVFACPPNDSQACVEDCAARDPDGVDALVAIFRCKDTRCSVCNEGAAQ